ncbi:MAG: phosphoglucosamine mutase [Synergistaceae bacterium]|jgi:phosphoglucosamine mutase|nr:phosphoglucosamine mutase [Synergistaceae bacterium]
MVTPERVRCLFGTDGVRDVANSGIMMPEMALRLGRAFVLFLTERGIPRPRIAVGRDTRRSGVMLESALVSGMMSAGADIHSLGVFPTPGVSYVLRNSDFDGGGIISASHNPVEYNGIKFLDGGGAKLSDDDEATIEEYLGDNLLDDWRPTGASIGGIIDECGRADEYAAWLSGQLAQAGDCDWPIVVDAANGAASSIALTVFSNWRGRVAYTGVTPDGLNINEGVGVIHIRHLAETVKRESALLGFALDGDADRVLLCDSLGRVIDGDIMLWIISRYLASRGQLGSGVVSTVMSNMLLDEKMAEEGIEIFRSQVGDRYVVEMMHKTGARLGGEQSGHIIALDYASAGDGLNAGILFLRACRELGEDISTLIDRFPRYPQVLRNIRVADRESVLASLELEEARACAEEKLSGGGRILLRSSGTEPLLRILVEAKDEGVMRSVCDDLERAVRSISGGDA